VAAATELPVTKDDGPSRTAVVLVLVLELVLLVLAAVLVAGSLLSYATVKHRLDAFASDHDANLSVARFHAVVWQVRALAAGIAAAALATQLRRRAIATAADAFGHDTATETRALAVSARRALAADSALHLAALGGIAICTVLVRLDFLFQPMRYDESVTYVHYASRPIYIGLTTYTAPNNHVLHTVLVHISTALFGGAPWAIRLPAFLAGVLLVPLSYVAARLLYGRAAALLAAALVAGSSTLIEYSTNARGYTIVALLTAALVALGVQLRSSRSVVGWAAFAVLAALGLWTVPTMVYAIVTVAAWLAVTNPVRVVVRRLVPALVAAAAIAVVLYLPIVVTSGLHSLTDNSFVAPRTIGYVGHHLPSSLAATFRRWNRDEPAALWLPLALAFLTACAFHRRLSRVAVAPALGVVAALPIVVAQRVVPFERVWLFLLPLYLLTVGAGGAAAIRRLPRPDLVAPFVALALAASLAGEAAASRAVSRSEDTSTFRDAPAVAAFLERAVRPGDRVLAAPPADAILEYYFDDAGLDGGTLLYGDPSSAPHRFAVVKEGAGQYPLTVVLAQHGLGKVRAVVLRRFPHAVVYRLRP
jgi:hypothetical protein